jgi:hypothetical protein
MASSVAQPSTANGPRSSEQVIFSGVAFVNSSFAKNSPVGFWIWCEAESSNPYDEECNGSMYFYELGITRHVEGEIAEVGEDTEIYDMTVSSTRDDKIKNCVLRNLAEPELGPNNTVRVTCQDPAGTAFSNNAVVKVTGPG